MQVDVAGAHHRACPSDARGVLVFTILAELQARKITVAVLNGVDGPSARIGRDVDLLIRRKDLSAVTHLARAVAARQGWNYATGRWLGSWVPRGLYQQVFHRVDAARILNVAFDLICSNGIAAGLITAYSPRLLDGPITISGGVPITIEGAYMKSGFIKALAGIEAGLANVEAAQPLPREVRRHIAGVLGNRFLRIYERSIMRGDLRSTWRTLRRHAQLAYAWRHPVAALRNGAISFTRRFGGSRMDRIQSIAIVAPDSAARSLAVNHASRMLAEAFLDVRYRDQTPPTHTSRTRMFTSAGAVVGQFETRALSWCYALREMIRYWLRERRATTSEIPVNLYREYAFHVAADSVLAGPALGGRHRWLSRVMGKVRRTIVLSDRPAQLVLRDTALPDISVRRPRGEVNARGHEEFATQIIDVQHMTAEAVGAEIARAILDYACHLDSVPGLQSSCPSID